MILISRGWLLAAGMAVSLGGVFLARPMLGQQDAGQTKKAEPPPPPVAPVIGTIDVDQVFRSYDKLKVLYEQYQADLLARKNELMKIMSEATAEAEMLAKLTPGTDDYKKHENRVTELKARHEAGREQAEREFRQRDAEMLATIYKEVQTMAARYAKYRKMNYVVKVSNQAISGTDPNSVMSAMSSMMVYADPHNDITNDVIYHLNRQYRASGGRAPASEKGAAGVAGSPRGAGQPVGR